MSRYQASLQDSWGSVEETKTMHIEKVLISVVGINALKLQNSKLFECPVKLTRSFVERLRVAPKVFIKKKY